MKILLLIVALISLTSCCGVKETAFVKLPLPPEIPESSKLTQADLICVSDEALDKIILLDKRRKTLEGIIKSTHNSGQQSATE